ncbi:2-acylglycerol O-acyltransferase 1 (Acyl-CoA:monoacylglycerol acyltransferase 1) (MGAT1) (Diacylglycerol acyltransferase 2-like protein 1) (Monoacylglycerol O-acyltransferase 1) [Durusdinium trenchii]|uniref:2-acylglycerol O-acyltransferase 1 (Acyl-CoA:monoacylglycerol acyltransferase 1) (MGAT1) (Diacylglycerol acyltransferase 2-like protein 1) (Monoacylglycerol O-acyltransferase 1) n=1 Tax=Durusdinium trenchii TaxID=1381693 RepID=A0ABP0H665_9DINO
MDECGVDKSDTGARAKTTWSKKGTRAVIPAHCRHGKHDAVFGLTCCRPGEEPLRITIHDGPSNEVFVDVMKHWLEDGTVLDPAQGSAAKRGQSSLDAAAASGSPASRSPAACRCAPKPPRASPSPFGSALAPARAAPGWLRSGALGEEIWAGATGTLTLTRKGPSDGRSTGAVPRRRARMLNALQSGVNGAVDLVVSGLRTEVEQVSKMANSELAEDQAQQRQQQQQKHRRAKSEFREGLLEMEKQRKEMEKRLSHQERELKMQIAALELENSKLRNENDFLAWEPKKARDGLVLLLVSLSSIFGIMCFAIYVMAENQIRDELWAQRAQGHVLFLLGSTLIFGAVPLTHLSGQYLYGRVGYKFYQPGQGGRTYCVLQAFGWAFYALYLLLGLLVFAQEQHGIATASGVCGVVAQALMVSSLLSFRPDVLEKNRGSSDGYSSGGSTSLYGSDTEDGSHAPIARRKSRRRMARSMSSEMLVDSADNGMESDFWLDSSLSWNAHSKLRLDVDTALYAAFMMLNSTLVFISFALAFISETAAHDTFHRYLLVFLSLKLVILALALTNWLGGILSNRASWSVWRPFAGGTRYLILQGFVWTLFGACCASQFSFLMGVPMYLFAGISGSMEITQTGLAAVLGHLLLVLSMSYYKTDEVVEDQGIVAEQVEPMVDRKTKEPIPPALVRSAEHFWFSHLRDRKLMERLHERMTTRYTGLRAFVGTTIIVQLCNTQYMIFIIATTVFYTPFPLSCAISDKWCVPQPPDTWAALEKFSFAICAFTIVYSILKTFQVRGTIRIVILILLNIVPVSFALYMHQDSDIFPFLSVILFLFMLYNYKTYSGMPEITGCREWPWFRSWRPFWSIFQDYTGSELVTDPNLDEFEAHEGHTLGSSESSAKQGIWCFHPHGIFPTSMITIPNSPMFRDRFPNLWLTSMTASIIHVVPLMRDIAQWAGVRDVGRESVDYALRTGKSPMLVVGGQSEMFESKSWPKDIVVHRGHRGFVRMALRHGVPLIPTFSFGEHMLMDNVYLPTMQAWCKSRLGFPIPYLPYGRWKIPLTRRAPTTFCVGKPVFPREKVENPTKADIDELHKRYFAALEKLFEDNKVRCGFPDHGIQWAQ